MNKVLAGVASFVFVMILLQSTSALSQSIPLIGADRVWALQVNGQNITGSGQVVCVIDSGIDYTHPDLGSCTRGQFLNGNCEKVIGGYAFYDNVTADKNDIMDNWGHGTHVSGIIAANGNVKGVAPEAKLVGVKACSPGFCDDGAILDAFNWCLDNADEYGITIISMSVGHDIYNRAQCDSLNSSYNEAFATARARGIPVVVAGGNDGSQNGLAFPACLSNTIAVGATTKSDTIAGFSDRNSAMMSLMGPGQDIISTWRGGIIASMSGTSQATPHVSGTIALINQILAEQGQSKTPIEIEDLFEETGLTVTDNNGATYKRVDAFAAANALLQTSASNTTNQTNSTNQNNTNNQTPIILDFSMRFIAPTEGQVIRSNNFTASIEANMTLDSMDINLDGGAYYHACNNCDAFTVPVDRLQDGLHTLNLIGVLGSVTKELTIQFIVNTTTIQQNATNQTQQNQTNTTVQPLTGFSIVSPIQGAAYNDSVTISINVGNANVVNYSVDGGSYVAYSSPITMPLSTGSHIIAVRASNSGSFNQTSVGFTVVNTTIVVSQNQTNATNSTNQNNTNNTSQNNQPATLTGFTINSPLNGATYNNSVNLDITVGSATMVNYSINNGTYIDYTNQVNIPLPAGNHQITVRASSSQAYNQTTRTFSIVNTTIVTQPVNNTNQTQQNQTNQNNTNNTSQTPAPVSQTGSSSSSSGGGGGGGSGKVTTPKKNSTANATNYSVTIELPDFNALIHNLSLKMNSSVGTKINIENTAPGNNTSNNSTKVEKSTSKIGLAIKQLFRNMIADFNNLIFKIFRVGI